MFRVWISITSDETLHNLVALCTMDTSIGRTLKYRVLSVSYPLQFLLGAFYYVEAVVLLEDIITKVPAVNETARTGYTYFSSVTYYDSQDITDAYKRAA